MEWRGPHPARLVSPATVRVAADAVLVESARLSGRDWTGEIDRLRWQPGRLQSRGRFSGLQAAAFLKAAAPTSSLTLGAQWDIDFGERLAGHARVFREQGDLSLNAAQPLPLGLDRALLSAEFAGRQVQLALEATGARAGTARGTLALELRPHEGAWTLARTSPWRGALQLDVPSIAWASPLLGENVALEGRLQGGFTLAGTPAAPATSGQVTGNALALRLLNEGLELGGGVMQIDFTPDLARLRRLEFTSVATRRPLNRRIDFAALTAQPGQLTAEGEFALKKGEGRLKLVADRLTVSQLPNRWIMVSGNGALALGDHRGADRHGRQAHRLQRRAVLRALAHHGRERAQAHRGPVAAGLAHRTRRRGQRGGPALYLHLRRRRAARREGTAVAPAERRRLTAGGGASPLPARRHRQTVRGGRAGFVRRPWI